MARTVTKTDKVPLEIKPQTQSVWICMCGLSKTSRIATVHTKQYWMKKTAKPMRTTSRGIGTGDFYARTGHSRHGRMFKAM